MENKLKNEIKNILNMLKSKYSLDQGVPEFF